MECSNLCVWYIPVHISGPWYGIRGPVLLGDSEIQRLRSEDIELGVWMSTGAVDSINTVVNLHGRKLDNVTIKGIPTEIWREILSWDDQTLKDRFEGLAKDVLVMDL